MSTKALMKNPTVAGALYDFLGFLTTRDKSITVGGSEPTPPVLDLLQEWAEDRGLSLIDAEVMDWQEDDAIDREGRFVSTSVEDIGKEREALADRLEMAIPVIGVGAVHSFVTSIPSGTAREIVAALRSQVFRSLSPTSPETTE